MSTAEQLYRVLDSNLNRSREGLRVCEEVARMVLNEPKLTRRCQNLRYALDAVVRTLPSGKLLAARSVRRDVGRPEKRGRQRPHVDLKSLAKANVCRVQEALRVIEEFSRLKFPEASSQFGRIRFRVYSLEIDLMQVLDQKARRNPRG